MNEKDNERERVVLRGAAYVGELGGVEILHIMQKTCLMSCTSPACPVHPVHPLRPLRVPCVSCDCAACPARCVPRMNINSNKLFLPFLTLYSTSHLFTWYTWEPLKVPANELLMQTWWSSEIMMMMVRRMIR